MNFIAIQSFKSPYVVATGLPHRPTAMKVKTFKKGEIISGELKKGADGNPNFVLYKGVIVVPLSCVKQVVTKEIDMSNVPGDTASKPTIKVAELSKEDKRKRYADAIFIGGILGFGATYYAEKQGWIAPPDKKNRIVGAVIGALAGAYFIYRFKK